MFEYWFCAIRRGCSVSRSFAGDGTAREVSLLQLVALTDVNGPVSVDVEMVFQSTWNLYTETALRNCHTTAK